MFRRDSVIDQRIGVDMSSNPTNKASQTFAVHIKADEVTQFSPGTRWEVVASSLGSLWEDTYTVSLRRVGEAGEET